MHFWAYMHKVKPFRCCLTIYLFNYIIAVQLSKLSKTLKIEYNCTKRNSLATLCDFRGQPIRNCKIFLFTLYF